MEVLKQIFYVLLIIPGCVFFFQLMIMKIGEVMAFKKAWQVFILELTIVFVVIKWIIGLFRKRKSPVGKEKIYSNDEFGTGQSTSNL